MKTGLYFGSFNPIHIGHMAIANYIIDYTDLDNIWFVISPQNPLKSKESLLQGPDRLKMAEIAIGNDNYRFTASDIEFRLPVPSYTIDTLTYLREKQPNTYFSLIMGEDNLYTLHKWKNADRLVETTEMYVYPRPGVKKPDNRELNRLLEKARINRINAPLMEISGSFIRNAIASGKDVRHFLPPGVWEYISKMGFYL